MSMRAPAAMPIPVNTPSIRSEQSARLSAQSTPVAARAASDGPSSTTSKASISDVARKVVSWTNGVPDSVRESANPSPIVTSVSPSEPAPAPAPAPAAALVFNESLSWGDAIEEADPHIHKPAPSYAHHVTASPVIAATPAVGAPPGLGDAHGKKAKGTR